MTDLVDILQPESETARTAEWGDSSSSWAAAGTIPCRLCLFTHAPATPDVVARRHRDLKLGLDRRGGETQIPFSYTSHRLSL